jgi:hypothetical protein
MLATYSKKWSKTSQKSLTQTQIDALLNEAWATAARNATARRAAQTPPSHWREWCLKLFPDYFQDNFGARHETFWDHVDSIKDGDMPPAGVFIWPRGSGKSTTAETAVVRIGALDIRLYCWYVCETQDQADKHVATIAGMLESKTFVAHYPDMARRLLGKNGNSRGWNRALLRTASGYNVEAIGLDKASRGGKMDWARPDVIIFDDVDNQEDSPATVEKKIRAITTKILPAGSKNVAVFFMQNLIHPTSIAAKLVGYEEQKADFLLRRIVSGPFPAIEGLAVKQTSEGYKIIGGYATWSGQSREVCQQQIDLWGLAAFLREAQHEVSAPPGGIFSHLEFEHCTFEQVPWRDIVRTTVWVDPAVTDTDQSDSMGIQCDALAENGMIYRLWSWEAVTSPPDALKRAILKAVEYRSDTVGIETDQGGDTWKSVYKVACQMLADDPAYPDIVETGIEEYADDGKVARIRPFPKFKSEKAGQGHGSKAHRASQMLVDYERGKFTHVIGTHQTLERALYRFPKTKPFDLTDACYWCWYDLRGGNKKKAGTWSW